MFKIKFLKINVYEELWKHSITRNKGTSLLSLKSFQYKFTSAERCAINLLFQWGSRSSTTLCKCKGVEGHPQDEPINNDIITVTCGQHGICLLSTTIAYNPSCSQTSLQPHWPPHCSLDNPTMLLLRILAVQVLSDLCDLPTHNNRAHPPSFKSLFKRLFKVDLADYLPPHPK